MRDKSLIIESADHVHNVIIVNDNNYYVLSYSPALWDNKTIYIQQQKVSEYIIYLYIHTTCL